MQWTHDLTRYSSSRTIIAMRRVWIHLRGDTIAAVNAELLGRKLGNSAVINTAKCVTYLRIAGQDVPTKMVGQQGRREKGDSNIQRSWILIHAISEIGTPAGATRHSPNVQSIWTPSVCVVWRAKYTQHTHWYEWQLPIGKRAPNFCERRRCRQSEATAAHNALNYSGE